MTGTTNEFHNLKACINAVAIENGLIVIEGNPNCNNIASVTWNGDWLSFLDVARKVNIQILYISERKYDPDIIIVEETGDPDIIYEGAECESDSSSAFDSKNKEKKWLLARIRESLTPWEKRNGEVISVSCVVIKENVAHHWGNYADWVFNCHEAIGAVIEEAEEVEHKNRVLYTKDAAQKIHEYAIQMAQHPRFPDATSEEKRVFMANQLFPDLENTELLGYGSAISIAKRAVLIYWWDIEPIVRVTKVKRVQELHSQGESIRNIATILKISEAKVRAALTTTL